MKAQYGVDTTNPPDGSVDCWTSAIPNLAGAPCNGVDYSPAAIQAMGTADLTRIVAVRIGIVVQSDEYAIKDIPADTTTYLFNCSLNTDADCQGRIPVNLPKYWRYRVYETVVPLRNTEWNTQ